MKKIEGMDHIWSVICSQSTIDSETNNLTLVSVIEKLTITIPKNEIQKAEENKAKGFVFPINFEVTSLLRKKDSTKNNIFDFRIRMLNQSNQIISSFAEQKIVLKEGLKNIRIRNRFNSIPVEKTGEYSFVIEIKNITEANYTEIGKVPLDIVISPIE